MDDVKKPFYKRWYFWAIIILVSLYFIGKSNEDSKYEEAQDPSSFDDGSANIAPDSTSSAADETVPDAEVSDTALAEYREKVNLGTECAGFYSSMSEYLRSQDNIEDADVAKTVSFIAFKYAQKYADQLPKNEEAVMTKIAKRSNFYSDLLAKASLNETVESDTALVKNVRIKCEASIEQMRVDL